jgi:hypothetical protein
MPPGVGRPYLTEASRFSGAVQDRARPFGPEQIHAPEFVREGFFYFPPTQDHRTPIGQSQRVIIGRTSDRARDPLLRSGDLVHPGLILT